MTSSRHSCSLGSSLPQRPGSQSAVTHLPPPVLALVNPRCCYTDAKWKSSTGLLSKHVVWGLSSSPSHWNVCDCQKRSWTFRLHSVLCVGKAFLDPCVERREFWALPAPAPPSREPTVPLLLCPWARGPSHGCVPCPRISVPPASEAAHARVSLAPNRDSETKCVLWPFHVCLSCFNTEFITCSEINVRKYYLSNRILNYLICVLSVSPRHTCILLATFVH